MIIWSAVLALWVFSFVLGFILLSEIRTIAERIEDNQRANVCISLIREPTSEDVTKCVEKNRTRPKKFEFNGVERSTQATPPTAPKTSIPALEPVEEVEPVTEILKRKEPVTPPPATSQVESAPSEAEDPKIEARSNNGVLEYRYEGDTLWQVATGDMVEKATRALWPE
jgi:hypothetical protein